MRRHVFVAQVDHQFGSARIAVQSLSRLHFNNCLKLGHFCVLPLTWPWTSGVSVHGVQQRLAQADRIARAVGLDMVAVGWRPTVDNYLGRVTKPRILEAVREAKGHHAAQLLDHLKKGEMAQEAERLLDGTGWLPEPLRLADGASSSDPPAGVVETLPAFLTDGEDAHSQRAAE